MYSIKSSNYVYFQVFASNFRSLKQVKVRFSKGKNVIVGKNNSGKSNILKGLDILIGEKWPSFHNFTDNDFYTYEEINQETGEIREIISNDFYIEAELEKRDFDEDLISQIKKSTAFSKVKSKTHLYKKSETGEVIINYDFFQRLDEVESRDEVDSIGINKGGYAIKTSWKKPDELLTFLKSSKIIKIFFCKSRIYEENVGLGLLCIDQDNSIWISHFLTKKLRESLITTTIISALRSQKEELRLVYYTWFGKLIAGLWNESKISIEKSSQKSYEELIASKSLDIKYLVDTVFSKDTNEITKLLGGAIAHKSVSFKFLNDSKDELYKNVQVFVNDGIDRPLNEKGTGIQSAIIIALFSLYCNKFHNRSSLLIAEEPELFLHPQARRVISAELDKFIYSSENQERQLIISTHSIEYLKNVDPFNIVRVYKDDIYNCSITKQLDEKTSNEITTELKRFIWSNNTELFFADKVILVEGAEVYLIPSLVDKITSQKQLLDYLNITIARVNGKGSFLSYIKMLDCFNINYFVLGDLDCFKDEVIKISNYLNLGEIINDFREIQRIISELEINYEEIKERIKGIERNHDAKALKNVFEKFNSGIIKKDDHELKQIIEFMQKKYTKGDKVSTINNSIGSEKFQHLLNFLRSNSIFIWSKGELENYYNAETKQMSGSKDLKALELSYLLLNEDTQLEKYFNNIEEINLLISSILKL